MSYNGWKNRATWDVNVHLTNHEGVYHLARGCADASDLEETFKDFASKLGYDEGIDWNKIYKGLQDES